MHLCACVSEERGDGEGEDSQVLSDTLRDINLDEVPLGLVVLCGPMHLCVCVSKDHGDREDVQDLGDREGVVSQEISDTLRDINLDEVGFGLMTLCGPIHLCVTVTASAGMRNHDKRVSEIVVRELKRAKPDAWG